MFDLWSLMGTFLYVEVFVITSAQFILLEVSRCSTTHSGPRGHLRDTAPFPSSEPRFMHSIMCSRCLNEHNGY